MKAVGVDQVIAHAGAIKRASDGFHAAASVKAASASQDAQSAPGGKVVGHG